MNPMKLDPVYRPLFSCGTHIHGHGLPMFRDGRRQPGSIHQVINQGVIVTMPNRKGDPYTVLDEQNFTVFEVQEDHLSLLTQ